MRVESSRDLIEVYDREIVMLEREIPPPVVPYALWVAAYVNADIVFNN